MSQKVDIAVIGGGVIGLASAIAMALRGFKVVVLDAGALDVATMPQNTRVYAINDASKDLFEQLGVWPYLTDVHRAAYQKMQIWDATNLAEIAFDAQQLGKPQMGFMLEENAVRVALLKRVATLDILLVPHARVKSAKEHTQSIEVTTEDARQFEAAFCMIADGANSKVRTLLNVPLKTWSYQQDALVATVKTEKPHQKTAYQVFHPDGPLAFLPLADAHESSIVWSQPPSRIKALMSLGETEFTSALTDAFASTLGEVELLSQRASFPLCMRHVEQYVGDRWLILGDAAHTIHPLAGLGLNVGLADLATWVRLLDAHKGHILSRRVLDAYQRERKHAVWSVIALMQGIKTLFGPCVSPIRLLRGQGMRILNQMSPLKRMLMAYASGVDKA